MTTPLPDPSAPPEEVDSAEDDQHWFELMAGRAAPEARPAVRAEAAWLRAAMLSYRSAAPQGGPAEAELRIARLLERARREGALPASTAIVLESKPANIKLAGIRLLPARWGLGLALAASLALLIAPPELLRTPATEESQVQRGEPIQILDAADPPGRRQQVMHELEAAGFRVAAFDRLGRPGLDVDMPSTLSDTHIQTLERLGLRWSSGPSLQIEFRAPRAATPASAP